MQLSILAAAIAAFAVASPVAFAQQAATSPATVPAAPADPTMVVMPLESIEAARAFINHPQIDGAANLWALLGACEAANQPDAPDRVKAACPWVVKFLASAKGKQDAKPAPSDTPATK